MSRPVQVSGASNNYTSYHSGLRGLHELHVNAQALQHQKLPRTEVVSKPSALKPSAPISAPPTPPNREAYRDKEEEPHIGSPLSVEGTKWLKQHDPSIASACNSNKGASLNVLLPQYTLCSS